MTGLLTGRLRFDGDNDIGKLTARQVKTAGTGQYWDGNGRRLIAAKTGAKKWQLQLTINSKRREMGLGSYPTVRLAKARSSAEEYKRQASEGVDPIAAGLVEEVRIPNFTTCAARYIRSHRRGWSNAEHARQWVSTLKTYARPVVGSKSVDAVCTEDVLQVLSPI